MITWLQSSLSDYTSAWLLYLGLFFMLMILYAPAGLWGVIATHRRMWRSPARVARKRNRESNVTFVSRFRRLPQRRGRPVGRCTRATHAKGPHYSVPERKKPFGDPIPVTLSKPACAANAPLLPVVTS